ncbi:Glycolipid transfer protein 3 [Sesamum angolense]|uniref:Glycolipid transfer protein 3 n=1 Tax=Sesamum angolense TaxID=2727404 RepID=A0AAE1WCT9_9LAMI|nr:Glycolipid transfer protein 3 [Sesamum angolense]
MKRRREAEMVASEIRSAIEELSLLAVNLKTGGTAADDVHDQTAPMFPSSPFYLFAICSFKFLRLENFHESDPSIYWDVVEILKKEVNEGKAKKGPTCSKALFGLLDEVVVFAPVHCRSLDFTLALLQLLVKDFGRNMEQAVEESYSITLKPWHGWISSAAYRVALKLVPDTQTLLNILKVKDEDDDMLKEEIQNLISLLMPVLEQNKDILRTYGLDKLKST